MTAYDTEQAGQPEQAATIQAKPDAGAVDRVESHKSYNAIDRYLRNNMDDEEYAEYSAELDRVFSYASRHARQVPDEVTPQMWTAGGKIVHGWKTGSICAGVNDVACLVWKAMLSATPPAPDACGFCGKPGMHPAGETCLNDASKFDLSAPEKD